MIQIRQDVFETNSSSVHTLTICKKSEYQDWLNNKVLLIEDYPYDLPNDIKEKYLNNKSFITEEDAKKVYEYCPDYWDFNEMFVSINDYNNDYDLYNYEEEVNIENNDYIIFGKHGYMG